MANENHWNYLIVVVAIVALSGIIVYGLNMQTYGMATRTLDDSYQMDLKTKTTTTSTTEPSAPVDVTAEQCDDAGTSFERYSYSSETGECKLYSSLGDCYSWIDYGTRPSRNGGTC